MRNLISVTSIYLSALLLLSGCRRKEPVPPPSAGSREPTPPSASTTAVKPQAKDSNIFTNSIGMKLILIPPGEFMMGSPAGEADKWAEKFEGNERPQHRVRISKGFYMSVTEVTQAQWKAIMGNNPSHFQGDNLPVEQVSWNDVVEFCNKLSQKEGKDYRLPTEAEWEYACRAGTTTRFYFGDNYSMLSDYGWSGENGGWKTHPVGQKKPNAFGLYDMHGNVWEWCSDWHQSDYYTGRPNPDVNPTGPVSSLHRVCRGGSWHFNQRSCRSAIRLRDSPNERCYDGGFRVVLDF